MGQNRAPIRTEIGSTEFDGVLSLEQLRETLAKNKPELLREAASEMLTAKQRLDHLVGVLDRHLRALDEHWTVGEDAKVVKTQLRRLRESADQVSTTISEQSVDDKQCLANPSGVAPALVRQAHTLATFRGENLPESPDRDVSILEGATQGGMAGLGVGAGVGVFFGGVGAGPGAVIGAVVGTVAGGITAAFTDGPFMNTFGDSKEEQDRNLATEHIKLLSEATKANNQVFPAELRTDIPEFEVLDPNLPIMPVSHGTLPSGGLPAGLSQPFGPLGGLPDGLYTPGQDGLQDPSRHRIPGFDDTGLNVTFPGDTDGTDGIGTDGSGKNGVDPPAGVPNPNGAAVPGVRTPDAPTGTLPDTSVGGPTTSLAGLPDSTLAGHPTGYPSGNPSGNPSGGPTGTGSPSTGLGSPYGGSGAGAAVGGGASAALLRGSGGNGSSPMMIPPGGANGAQEQKEQGRSTYLLEDEDYFTSEVPTTGPYISGESRGRA
ncbi:hypothetical protein LDL08_42880 [Nonomuraea glycinis]|uniref:Uncharacterized protein n=1 Tax=Nonomuraea glycinis TaxID=2047744 RepID=A0A918AF32_9ACTN|nr:hypothetical protein [Nonomuraea glycinis]MCA2182922.1 hypothetical protein [Nonomuraea glycinis]GGP17451.1 hypothetical protein GCM10012278_85740 [Nonomuraea glycinis]